MYINSDMIIAFIDKYNPQFNESKTPGRVQMSTSITGIIEGSSARDLFKRGIQEARKHEQLQPQ